MEGLWLRPCGPDKVLLPLPTEVAEAAQAQADEERVRAEAAEERASQERDRAERLLARLRELGVEE
jgi:EAL domain-containing protein (putative c-di-GMP-specific phosphodiesterase class I)